MVNLHPEYIIDQNKQRKSVVLPFEEWQALMLEMEELDEIRAYDAAMQESGEVISFDQAVKEIEDN